MKNLVFILLIVSFGANAQNKTVILKVSTVDTATMLAPYALNYNVVHKTGTETITGAKTFTEITRVLNNTASGYQMYDANRGYFIGLLPINSDSTFTINYDGIYGIATRRVLTINKTGEVLIPNLSTAGIVTNANTGQLSTSNGTGFIKMSGGAVSYDNSTFLTTSSASSTYVPYTGATTNVALGAYNLAATRVNLGGATDDGSTALNVTGSGKFNGLLTIKNNVVGLVLNRDAVTNYNGIGYQTATVQQWFVGMRENLSSNNLIIYNENTAHDALTISTSDAVKLYNLAGTGSRIVVADASGTLSATDAAPTSGTYTPTITLVTNVASSTARVCQYMRVGSVVTVSGYVTVTATTPAAGSRIYMSLPISSSFTSTAQAGGAGGVPGGANIGTVIFANSTSTTVSMDFLPVSGSTDYWFSYTYQIL